MGIYDLNDIDYFKHDIENILDRINELYKIDFHKERTTFYPKTQIDNKNHWTSEVCKESFNKLVPLVKSLHKNMYAFMESTFMSKNGMFDKLVLERRYQYLKEFRLLNNKFK